MQSGLYTEALLLAQCAGVELWNKTQQEYFNIMIAKYDRPVLRILQAVTNTELLRFVENSVLENWKETLAVLSTYAKTEEFPFLCVTLAERLEYQIGNFEAATLCYMCANKVPKVVSAWAKQLHSANVALGHLCTKSLQQFIEKVVVFTKTNAAEEMGNECVAFFAEYASLLASQGRLDVAAKYLYGDNEVENILRDRVYQATPNKPAGSKAPPFPFAKVQIANSATKHAAASAVNGRGAAAVPNAASSTSASRNAAVVNAATTPVTASQQQFNNQTANAAPAPAADPNALPQGWLQLVDPSLFCQPSHRGLSVGTSCTRTGCSCTSHSSRPGSTSAFQ